MHGTWLIEVGYKDGVTDPTGLGLEKDCRHAGIKGVQQVAVSQLYRLVGALTPEERQRLASDLLTDPIIQTSRDGRCARRMPRRWMSVLKPV